MIKIKFYSLIRIHLGINEVEINAHSIPIYIVLQEAEKQINKTFIDMLITDNMKIISGTMILINGRNIFHLENLESIVKNGDEISIFPTGGGG